MRSKWTVFGLLMIVCVLLVGDLFAAERCPGCGRVLKKSEARAMQARGVMPVSTRSYRTMFATATPTVVSTTAAVIQSQEIQVVSPVLPNQVGVMGATTFSPVEVGVIDSRLRNVKGSPENIWKFYRIYMSHMFPDWEKHTDRPEIKRELATVEKYAASGSLMFDISHRESLEAFNFAAQQMTNTAS